MITVITDLGRILNLHKAFHKTLKSYFDKTIDCWVGYPGGNFEDRVSYSSDLNIWVSRREHDTRFWNGFGIDKPLSGSNNSLVGEINFPYEGINRRVAGVFAEEDNGNILVLHRGRIGGGKLGIGKKYFTDNFRGDFVTALDGERESEFCLIGELNSEHFPKQVANFINEIHRVKKLEDNEKASAFSELSDFKYTSESFGRSTTERNDPKTIDRTHGIVVNALAKELKERGKQVANDKNRDLFIHNRSKITTLFEIKTSSSTQCLYSAVGQLLIYSIPIKNTVDLIAVLPTKLSTQVSNKLASVNIKVLYYRWEDGDVSFENLELIL